MNKVEGKEHLVKDPNSGSVVNTNIDAYKIAKQHKQRIIKDQQEKDDLKNRVDQLEQLINQFIDSGKA